MATARGEDQDGENCGALLEYLVAEPRLRYFHRLLVIADLSVELVEEPFTILAPLDAHWPAADLEDWMCDPDRTEDLFDLCHSMLIRGAFDVAAQLDAAPQKTPELHTLFGNSVRLESRCVHARFQRVPIVDTVCVGPSIVHLLDGLLLPSSGLESRMIPASVPR